MAYQCPECGSDNVALISGASELQGRCGECGFSAEEWLFGPLPNFEEMGAEAEFRAFGLSERSDFLSCASWVKTESTLTRAISFRQDDGTARWATFAVCFDLNDAVLFAGFAKEADAAAFGRAPIPAGRASRAQAAFNAHEFDNGLDVDSHAAWDYSRPECLSKRVTLTSKTAPGVRHEVTFEVRFSPAGDVVFAGVTT